MLNLSESVLKVSFSAIVQLLPFFRLLLFEKVFLLVLNQKRYMQKLDDFLGSLFGSLFVKLFG